MRLFEIPVYRVSPEQWRREQTDREERFFACAPVRDLPLTDKQKSEGRQNASQCQAGPAPAASDGMNSACLRWR